MATTAVQAGPFAAASSSTSTTGAQNQTVGGARSNASGISSFYASKISQYQLLINDKTHNLRRLEAQRNQLNGRVRLLREEMQLLQEPGSHVGEVIKVMSKKKVLVKVQPEGKYVVDFDTSIPLSSLVPTTRVALRSDSYQIHRILPNKVDPLVSLMMVEKVPDSTYEMVGGLERQIKEIKEVIELPVKHPELFDSLGIAQPKGVLLYGPPGTGKTLLARAVAHHTDCRFIRVSGSELVQKYIGEGSRMVRELFIMAREHAPSIIFMDEIDSIGSSRKEGGSGGGDSEVQRTMLELLNQLDGFEGTKNIKVSQGCAVQVLPVTSPDTDILACHVLSLLASHRSSWPQTVSIFWTQLCCVPAVSTERLSSHLQAPRPESPSCAFTRVRCRCSEASTCEHLQRRWARSPVRRCEVSAQKQACTV